MSITADSPEVRNRGWRKCKRHPNVSHHPELLACDCMRSEVPPEHRALSSGALAVPDRGAGRKRAP